MAATPADRPFMLSRRLQEADPDTRVDDEDGEDSLEDQSEPPAHPAALRIQVVVDTQEQHESRSHGYADENPVHRSTRQHPDHLRTGDGDSAQERSRVAMDLPATRPI